MCFNSKFTSVLPFTSFNITGIQKSGLDAYDGKSAKQT